MKRTQSKSSNSSRAGRSQVEQEEQGGMDNALHELFLDELSDIYNAEQQLTKALPKMVKTAESDELRTAFEEHLEETENQISRLDEVFQSLDESPKRKKCKGMEGLIEEAKEMMEEMSDSGALDASLIASAQKVEHYEIASYGTLCTWAEMMNHTEALDLLKENLSEEKNTDERLTQIAESLANVKAEQEEE